MKIKRRTMKRYLFLIILISYNVNCQINENSYFVNSADLNPNVALNWNYTSNEITFKIVAKTDGWIGFGLSPNGGMKNSDIMLTWTNPSNGNIEFRDAHVENQLNVLYDTVQNWQKLFYLKNNGVTTVIFKRLIKICNTNQPMKEINLEVAPTSYVIYAWGTSSYSDGTPTYHLSNRGSRSLPLLSSLNKDIQLNMDELEYFDYRARSKTLSTQETEYYCEMFKLPEDFSNEKRHLIRYDTLVTAESAPFVHHWTMNECSERIEEYLSNNPFPEGGTCAGTLGHTAEWDAIERLCTKTSFAWATGGDQKLYIPENLGYPVGGSKKSFKYFFVQFHYENINGVANVIDNSGVRMYFTKNYRPTEMGIYTISANTAPIALTIPPKIKSLTTDYICNKETMNRLYNGGEITVFAQFPHTHYQGQSVFSYVVRDGKKVERIANNKYFDNKYQYINNIKPVIMGQDDEFLLTCKYQSEDKDISTYGGLGTNDEMCFHQIWYYPINEEESSCYNSIDYFEWLDLFKTLNDTGDINWTAVYANDDYLKFFKDSFKDIENSPKLMNNPDRLQEIFQNFYDNSGRTVIRPGQGVVQKNVSTNVGDFVEDACSTQTSTPTPPTGTTGTIDENTPFANSTSSGDGTISWNVTATDIIIKAQVTATGWLGFGISPDGKMPNSDMALVWQKSDGSIEFRDAHSFYYLVFPDFVQNWKKLFYSKKDGIQTIIISRKLIVPKQLFIPNIDINPDGLTNIIYASGDQFLFDFPTYHGPSKGSQTLRLR